MELVGRKLETALALLDDGIELVRSRARREQPGATAEQLDAVVQRWLAPELGHLTGNSARFFRLRPPIVNRR